MKHSVSNRNLLRSIFTDFVIVGGLNIDHSIYCKMCCNGHKICLGNRYLYRYFFYLEGTHVRRKSSYYLTTPIFYVNSNPHIGHLYTSVIADAIARFQRMINPSTNVKFMTGTDEHGLKISTSAKNHNMDEKSFCNAISQKYKELFDLYNISYTDFLRTTEERHVTTAQKLWNLIYDKGFIYSGEHKGWYCVSDETFISEVYLKPDETSEGIRYTREMNKPVCFVKEINYKFKLSCFQNDLMYWLEKGGVVKPSKFEKILKQMIDNEEVMDDLSISRPASRVKWGIPVPGDSSQNMYVWLDALSSYLTSSGYLDFKHHWPPDLHVIGKDILKFHGIYWPAFLIAAGLEPPKNILCHSHWLNNGQKMSKSIGNVVDPLQEANLFTSEGLRYFLLLEGVAHSDGNYNHSTIPEILNADLADKLGNLLNRCCNKQINVRQEFPSYSSSAHSTYCKKSAESLIQSLEGLPDLVYTDYENIEFNKGIYKIMATVSLTNKFFQDETPWKLKNNPSNAEQLSIILHLAMESLRVCGILLQPIVPKIAQNILNRLSVGLDERCFACIRPFSWQRNDNTSKNSALGENEGVLFRKIKC